MKKKILIAAITFFSILAAIVIYCLISKPAPFVYVMAHFGCFYDEYYDGSPDFKRFADDLRRSFEKNTKKDSAIILYYQPSFHADCVIRLTPDSLWITRINCRLDLTSRSKYDGIILKKDIKKYGAGELFKESMYIKVSTIVSPEMKSMRHKDIMPLFADGADITVVFYFGGALNAFEFHVSKYQDNRYNAIQRIVASILTKSGTVTAGELKNYGFDW